MSGLDLSYDVWCDGCQQRQQEVDKLKEELERIQLEHSLNYQTLKEKIISTDQLLKRYSAKCQEYDNQVKLLEESRRKQEKTQRTCETLELQLKTALAEVEPLKKAQQQHERSNEKSNARIQQLKDQLEASDAAHKQLNTLKHKLDQVQDELKEEKKRAKEKVRLTEISSKRNDVTIQRLQKELDAKKTQLLESKQEVRILTSANKKLEEKANQRAGLTVPSAAPLLEQAPRKSTSIALEPKWKASFLVPKDPVAMETSFRSRVPNAMTRSDFPVSSKPPCQQVIAKEAAASASTFPEDDDLLERVLAEEGETLTDIIPLRLFHPIAPALSPLPDLLEDFNTEVAEHDSSHGMISSGDESMEDGGELLEHQLMHDWSQKDHMDASPPENSLLHLDQGSTEESEDNCDVPSEIPFQSVAEETRVAVEFKDINIDSVHHGDNVEQTSSKMGAGTKHGNQNERIVSTRKRTSAEFSSQQDKKSPLTLNAAGTADNDDGDGMIHPTKLQKQDHIVEAEEQSTVTGRNSPKGDCNTDLVSEALLLETNNNNDAMSSTKTSQVVDNKRSSECGQILFSIGKRRKSFGQRRSSRVGSSSQSSESEADIAQPCTTSSPPKPLIKVSSQGFIAHKDLDWAGSGNESNVQDAKVDMCVDDRVKIKACRNSNANVDLRLRTRSQPHLDSKPPSGPSSSPKQSPNSENDTVKIYGKSNQQDTVGESLVNLTTKSSKMQLTQLQHISAQNQQDSPAVDDVDSVKTRHHTRSQSCTDLAGKSIPMNTDAANVSKNIEDDPAYFSADSHVSPRMTRRRVSLLSTHSNTSLDAKNDAKQFIKSEMQEAAVMNESIECDSDEDDAIVDGVLQIRRITRSMSCPKESEKNEERDTADFANSPKPQMDSNDCDLKENVWKDTNSQQAGKSNTVSEIKRPRGRRGKSQSIESLESASGSQDECSNQAYEGHQVRVTRSHQKSLTSEPSSDEKAEPMLKQDHSVQKTSITDKCISETNEPMEVCFTRSKSSNNLSLKKESRKPSQGRPLRRSQSLTKGVAVDCMNKVSGAKNKVLQSTVVHKGESRPRDCGDSDSKKSPLVKAGSDNSADTCYSNRTAACIASLESNEKNDKLDAVSLDSGSAATGNFAYLKSPVRPTTLTLNTMSGRTEKRAWYFVSRDLMEEEQNPNDFQLEDLEAANISVSKHSELLHSSSPPEISKGACVSEHTFYKAPSPSGCLSQVSPDLTSPQSLDEASCNSPIGSEPLMSPVSPMSACLLESGTVLSPLPSSYFSDSNDLPLPISPLPPSPPPHSPCTGRSQESCLLDGNNIQMQTSAFPLSAGEPGAMSSPSLSPVTAIPQPVIPIPTPSQLENQSFTFHNEAPEGIISVRPKKGIPKKKNVHDPAKQVPNPSTRYDLEDCYHKKQGTDGFKDIAHFKDTSKSDNSAKKEDPCLNAEEAAMGSSDMPMLRAGHSLLSSSRTAKKRLQEQTQVKNVPAAEAEDLNQITQIQDEAAPLAEMPPRVKPTPADIKAVEQELRMLTRLKGMTPNSIADRFTNHHPTVTVHFLADRIVEFVRGQGSEQLSALYLHCTLHNPDEHYPPFLPESEAKIVSLLQALEARKRWVGIMDSLLKQLCNLLQGREQSQINIQSKQGLWRLFTALCRLEGNMEHLRVAIHESIFDRAQGMASIVLFIAGIWPQVLQKQQGQDFREPLILVLEYLILVRGLEKNGKNQAPPRMASALGRLCHWSASTTTKAADLAQRILDMATETNDHEKPVSSQYECHRALEMLGCYEGWTWVNNELVRNLLWPKLQDWALNQVNSNVSTQTVCFILTALGNALSHCPAAHGQAVIDVMKIIGALVQVVEGNTVPLEVQEVALEVLLTLGAFDPDTTATNCQEWVEVHREHLKPNLRKKTLNFLEYFRIRNSMLWGSDDEEDYDD